MPEISTRVPSCPARAWGTRRRSVPRLARFSPGRSGDDRGGLALHPGPSHSPQVGRFLPGLRHHVRRVILPWDGLPAHRSRLVAQVLACHRQWLSVEWLPPYAPESKPMEPFWNHLDATVLVNTPDRGSDCAPVPHPQWHPTSSPPAAIGSSVSQVYRSLLMLKMPPYYENVNRTSSLPRTGRTQPT